MSFHHPIPPACLLVAALFLVVRPTPAAGQESTSRDSAPTSRVSGDFRLRGALDRDRRTSADRERGRIRLRISAEHDLDQGLVLGGRLVTAPNANDPNSTHQDLGDGFRNFRIALDRVYLKWKPDTAQPLEVWAGKFAHPFLQAPVFGELVWDADIQPEGVGVVFEPVPQLRLAGGAFLLQQQGNGEDANLGVAQATLRLQPDGAVKLTAALGVYVYGTPDASGARRLARDNQGNALVTDFATGDTVSFASEFRIWHGYAAGTYSGLSVPVTAVFQYVSNTSEADGSDGDGFAVGARLGSLGWRGAWQAEYQYQEIGREAVFSSEAQDDFLDATNFHGHMAGFSFQYLDNANVRFWTLWSAREEPREDSFQKRFRVDFNFNWKLAK